MDVFALDCDSLGAVEIVSGMPKMWRGNCLLDGTQVSVLKERDEVCLNGLLKSTDGRRLEAEVGLEVLCNLTNQALETKKVSAIKIMFGDIESYGSFRIRSSVDFW